MGSAFLMSYTATILIALFTSVYHSHLNIFQRIMSTLETLCATFEVYAIKQEFLYLANYSIDMKYLNAYDSRAIVTSGYVLRIFG